LTALDLLYYVERTGLNRTLTILQELVAELKAANMVKTARRYPQTAAIQRLGYILDYELHESKLSEALYKVLSDRNHFPVPLASSKEKAGESDNRWKIIKNTILESDL
jgi:predicted transcriptional regulator of viral defense system